MIELESLADGAGVDFEDLLLINLRGTSRTSGRDAATLPSLTLICDS